MIYKLNNKIIAGAFKCNGISYPANWLALSTNEEKLAIGISIEQPEIVETPWEVTRAAAIAQQIEAINLNYSETIREMVKDTPDFERESWSKQEQEAKSYIADPLSNTPYVDALSSSRGISREILLSKIIEKVTLYEYAHAYFTGLRQAKEDALKAMPHDCTLEDIQAVTWI
jgi:hypothetical protein